MKHSTLLIILLTAGLLLAGPVAAGNSDPVVAQRGSMETYRPVAPHTQAHRYRSRATRPVAIPEKGSLYSTGMVGNYSAVPLPEDFRYEDTAPWRRLDEVPVREASSQRRTRPLEQNERQVNRLQDNVRRVRPLD